MIQLTAEAVQNAPILRALYGDPPAAATCESIAGFADLVGRDRSNVKRSIRTLQTLGLVAEEAGALPVPPLTEAGRAVVEALDRAENAVGAAAGQAATWPHDKIRPDPANRKSADRDIVDLAASIEGVGVLEPLVLSPADANGFRTIRAGHRRWLAVQKLIFHRCDGFACGHPMPFVERDLTLETDAAEQALVAIVENGQRVDMTPLETARKFKRLIEETGWSAREAAKRTGYHERRVQEYMRVLDKAAPEDIARHEREPEAFTWEQLRDSVKQLDLSPKMGLLIVELADKCEREPSKIPGWSSERGFTWCGASPTGGTASELEQRGLIEIRRSQAVVGECAARVVLENERLKRWLDDNGFYDNREALLKEARATVVGPARAVLLADESGHYVTDWLNAPSRLSGHGEEAAPTAPASSRGASSSPGWTSPPDPAAVKRAEALLPAEKVILLELAHASAHGQGALVPAPAVNDEGPGYRRCVPASGSVGKLSQALVNASEATALIQIFREEGRNPPRLLASLTHAGKKVVHALAPGLQSVDVKDGDARLAKALGEIGVQPSEGRYHTEWLNEDWDLGAQSDLVKDLGHPEPEGPQIGRRARLALVELRHKIIAEGVEIDSEEGAVIGAFWLDSAVTELTKANLMRTAPRQGQRFLGVITPAGLEYLEANFGLGMGGIVGEQLLSNVRAEASLGLWAGPGYVSEWLNEAETPAASGAEPEQPPAPAHDREALQKRVEDEAQAKQNIVVEIDRFIYLGATGFGPFHAGKRSALLEACFGPGPYRYDAEHGCFLNGDDEAVFELLSQLDADEVQHAGGRLLEAILSQAIFAFHPEPLNWDAAPEGETPLQALARSCELVRDVLIRHYDALSSDPDVTLAYRHFSEALSRATRELKAAGEAQPSEAL